MEAEHMDLTTLLPTIAAQLRNALGSIRLAEGQLAPEDARERDPQLDRRSALLDQSYYRLLRLTQELSLAECLSEGYALHPQARDLVELVGQQCEAAAAPSALLGVELRFVCSLARHVCAVDAEALEQMLFHLLSNALKAMPSGGVITVELRRLQERVLLSVTDTGRGIPQAQLTSLFDRYLHPQPLSDGGLGLGLTLCRRLAELHGGTLMAESRPGQGSRFTLSLPDQQTQDPPMAFDASGGFNRTLLGLADALPAEAFLLRQQ